MRIFQLVLCVLAVPILATNTLNLSEEYQEWQEAQQLQEHSQAELKDLVVERDLLKDHVEKLKTDTHAREQLARRLGYITPDEVIYEVANSAAEETSAQLQTR